MKNCHDFSERGFGLVAVLMILGLLAALSTGLSVRIRSDTLGQAAFNAAARNLAAAETGINQATAQFRSIFVDGNVPSGSSPSHTGDYALRSASIAGLPIGYQLSEPGTNPTSKRLPLGVIPFGGLNVVQYGYSVVSGTPDLTNPSAQLRSQFQVNNIPVFQFLAFYHGRLEITPAADMTLQGRLHSNDDLYLNSSGNTLLVSDDQPNIPTVQVSAVGKLYRGRSDDGTCAGTVTIDMLQDVQSPHPDLDPLNLNCSGGTRLVSSSEVANWQGSIRVAVPNIGLPAGYSTARPGGDYWRKADLRIVLDLSTSYTQTRGVSTTVPLESIVVQDQSGSTDFTKTAALRSFMHARPGAIFYTDVPVTANNGSTLCTTQSAASSSNSTNSVPGSPCDVVSVADYRRYAPPFQGNTLVYRRADLNSGNNRDANWSRSADSSRDQLGNNGSSAIGDYRRGGFYNNREDKWMYLLNVDLQDLLVWDRSQSGANQLFDPNNTTNGGTILFLSVIGPLSNGINNYGVRVFDSPNLGYALNVVDPTGITVVSDQAMYLEGNFNSVSTTSGTGPTGIPWTHAPAALMGDSLNVLSQDWEGTLNTRKNDQKSADTLTSGSRSAANTTINAAFSAGVNPSGSGSAGYNGGLQNYPRLHEDWTGDVLAYRGSFVSLITPGHVNGAWFSNGNTYNMYNAPDRNWNYDPQFNDVAMLPPLTPTFISVQQIVISEDFR